MKKPISGAEIRQSFIDYFATKGHTIVPSSSLVPGGDQTLLFTNAGMVQFKEIFLGTDQRPYRRAVNSQKCMRVAGKHNDLDDVGRDDSHHTFFEMLGNWSFGDYYKKEAIPWAWDLLVKEWGVQPEKLWATCFKDDKGEIPADDEAYEVWKQQPGIIQDHIIFSGRKNNFWEMADTGPCGPCSEIHIDLGPSACNKKGEPGHSCTVNGDCTRYLELWNLVFIQYNRISSENLEPLPQRHVDTGMGFERIVSILQGVGSNYKTDLLFPIIREVQALSGASDDQRDTNITPYRVIADHVRAAAFLISDGVIPGNTGRSYVCRMIIRRAALFGSKIGLNEPFMEVIAQKVIEIYGQAYPEIKRNQPAILTNLHREEVRFKQTVDAGIGYLNELLNEIEKNNKRILSGDKAFELYATHGLPLELSRDIARERSLEIDSQGFAEAMEEHKLISGAGKAFGIMGSDDVDKYRDIFEDLLDKGEIGAEGVAYDPYNALRIEGEVLALIVDGNLVSEANRGDKVEVLLPKTGFYIESGGQVGDTGKINGKDGSWQVEVLSVRRPAAGVIIHHGIVTTGVVKTGAQAIAEVDVDRRRDIMRNHTATHLLHAELRKVLGDHARQAGSLVAPDHLRFDFNHPEPLTPEQLERIEAGVNESILNSYRLNITEKSLTEALAEGAMALFGEKYGEKVRTITIGDDEELSYELCGGTHVVDTSDIGIFIIISESSAAAGIRRIEAITGRWAYTYTRKKFMILQETSSILGCSSEELTSRVNLLTRENDQSKKIINQLRQNSIREKFEKSLIETPEILGIPVLSVVLPDSDGDSLRVMCDIFRQKHPSGVVVLGSVFDGRPLIVAAVTEDLNKRGLHAGEIVRKAAIAIDGSGGGRPTLGQAGGKDPQKIDLAMKQVPEIIRGILEK